MLPMWSIIRAASALANDKNRKEAIEYQKRQAQSGIGMAVGVAAFSGVWSFTPVVSAISSAIKTGMLTESNAPKEIRQPQDIVGEALWKAILALKNRSDSPEVIKKIITIMESKQLEGPAILWNNFVALYGKELASIRYAAKIPKQEDFAKTTSVSRPVISRFESSKYKPEYQTLMQIHISLEIIAAADPIFKDYYENTCAKIFQIAVEMTETQLENPDKPDNS